MKDQRDCVLNDLEEPEGKEFLFRTNQYNIKIFSFYLRLLPSCSSIHNQTNIESTQICSEDHLSVSRIRSPHLLLDVVLRVEDECLFFLPLGKLDQIELLVQYQSIFFARIGTVLEDQQAFEGLLGSALALDRLANANTSVFVVEVSCSSSSYSLLIKSVTNLFRP